ncbi:telomere-associated protein RIF1 [Candoia aspera]|uniref:telomere-associated protein RIF1 n=1 Tax=Candoia aspera TaxID=51853 RepID=UPI002FD80C17
MGPCAGSSLRALLETLEDPGASPGVLTDGLLTLTNRLTGEEGKEFAAEVGKHFPQLYKIFKTHIPTENSELSSAALQALGFCVFNPKIASLLCETEIRELLCILNSVAIKSGDKNTRTRALWVISKQSFPPHIVGKLVPSTIAMLETVLHKGDLHSMVVEYEALNVIIRLIEQSPSHMEEQAVKWAKLIIPLVVHSAHKVQLRGATALEMGVPLLQKHPEVAAVTEELMTIKVIPELQKLFSSKHETYVLKLWPLFVKLLGKALHRSGSFINSLLQLEELGFRSGTPAVKKIAFIAWKSLIDNFALNPEILCSAKRLKLLMQPLSSIHVRTEPLALTKLEVWWYLLMRLGPQLPAHFEQVCVPLIQSTLSLDTSLLQGISSRLAASQSLTIPGSAQKSGNAAARMSLNSSTGRAVAIPSIQLLGIEMLLHFFMGPEVLTFAKENNIVLSLEPLQYPVITSPSFFCKHASVFINAAQDGFIAIGKDASDVILTAIWKEIIGFVKAAIESGNKRERQSSEILTTLLQTLKNIILSKELPGLKSLSLIEIAIKELPPKVLGSPAYQVADMDLLNGTPALFLIQVSFCEELLKCGVQNERFFLAYESLVEYVLSGPTSPLAFSESVLTIVNQSALHLENKEHLWRIWSIVVNPLTEWIKQTNEVNQGDALEHNFSAIYCALLLPVKYIFSSSEFPQLIMKTLLRSWSELYRAFARCALLVATAEDNSCCDELCAKIISGLEDEAHLNQSMLDGLAQITLVMVECINFAPYDKKYQPTNRSPQTPVDWAKRKKDPLGKLSSLIKLLVILINSLQMLASKESGFEQLAPIGSVIVGVLQNIIGHISLPSVIRSVFGSITKPLAALYEKTKSANTSRMTNGLNNKFEKLLAESITCLQSHYTGSFNSELLGELSPLLGVMLLNKNKQVCSQAAQFWNATFGKAVNLAYPKGLKSVLYKAKQKFILLLPAFESCEIMDECNVTYSDYTEDSQWDANVSGITVKPNGKRDSLLAQTNEPEEKSINSHITPTKMKLEFKVSKPNRKNMLLEEENTVDFVFIPPETKERVLTEHQKEVLRTKRVDIPVMYNNLDASQDATLFSQDTQYQEDSLEKPTIGDVKEEQGKKENKLTPQNGEATSHQLVIPNEVNGNDKSNVSPERISSTTTEEPNILRKQKWDLKDEELNVCVPVQSSALDATLNENPSNCSSSSSSSSVSSDIISGTPQPVSRRQSFITLEKFDGLENRPFSPSTFSNNSVTSGTVPLSVQKESTIVSDVSSKEKSNTENKDALKLRTEEAVTRTKRTCLEILNAVETCVKAKKTKEENNANPKLQSNNMIGITKSSLRQNKTDSSEDTNSKQMQSDQEGKIQVSDKCLEDKHELSVDTQIAEHLQDNRSQVPRVSVTGSTAMESKPLLDIVPERNAGPDLEHKENTPPEIDVYEEAVSNVNQSTDISLNQKALRRSLRQKPETDGTVDSQDKENNQQKKDRRKNDEKILPKKMTQNRETSGQKEKAIPEKTTDAPISVPVSSATDGVNSKECHTSRNSQEQLSTNTGKSEGSPASDVEESGPDTTGEKPKVFPRYHTRRASQGFLTGIENSESDSSETREEGTKRKRPRKLKKNDSPGNQVKEEPENQELCSPTTVEIQARSVGKHKIHSGGEMAVALIASNSKEISTKEEKNTLPLSACLDLKENTGATHRRASSDTEKKPANRTESTSEPVLESRQETSILDTNLVACNNSKGASGEDAYSTAISALSSSKKLLDTSECQHKRSKRARRSRSCDCCDEKLSPQVEKLPPELKKASTPEPKLKEHRKMLSKVTVALTSILTAEDVHLAKRLSAEPCVTSTPLPPIKDCADLKEAGHVADSVSGVPRDDTPNTELGKSACVQSESDEPIAGVLDFVSFTEALLEPGSVDSPSKEPSAQGQHVEPEAVAVMEGGGKQSCRLTNRTGAEIRINQSEGAPGSGRVVQTAVEESTVTSAPVVTELQENEMGEEEDAESNTADTLSVPQASVFLQEKSDNLHSPPKCKELDALSLAKVSGSPTGAQARFMWSPSASPSTSILKRGIKRQQEEDSPSSANKNRRVSFANPIYQEELADDIDRRSPVVRTHPCNGSQSLRSAKFSPNHQAKLITTPTKGSLSPGTRSHKYKSSKKCLITEMVKEPEPTPTESIYPALVGCKASVDTILPQITSNIWARGLGQLIRAKNIRTVGDLSSLSTAEIKTLPIRSPKVSNVRKALKGYHEQQVKSRGLEEIAALDDAEKPLNGMDEKPFSTNEEAIIADLCEPEASSADEPSATDLCAQINLLADQITSESLLSYSGNKLFEMQEKLHSMTSCIMKNLKSRCKFLSCESTV